MRVETQKKKYMVEFNNGEKMVISCSRYALENGVAEFFTDDKGSESLFKKFDSVKAITPRGRVDPKKGLQAPEHD